MAARKAYNSMEIIELRYMPKEVFAKIQMVLKVFRVIVQKKQSPFSSSFALSGKAVPGFNGTGDSQKNGSRNKILF